MSKILCSTVLTLAIVLTLPSCRNEPLRVGAPNKTASVTLSALEPAGAALVEARKQFVAGTLPVEGRPAFNVFQAAYTKAKLALIAYGNALDTPTYNDKLLQDVRAAMVALSAAELNFNKSVKGK